MIQIGLVFGICLIGEAIVHFLPFPFPASVASMILLLILLLVGAIKVQYIQAKTDFLLKNMAFFFIPSGVGLMEHVDAVKGSLLPILLICILSTFLTFGATAFTIRAVRKLQGKNKP